MLLETLAARAYNKLFILNDITPDATFEEGGEWRNGMRYVRDEDKGIDFVEQNPEAINKWTWNGLSKSAQLAQKGHKILWGIDDNNNYMVKVMDGEFTTLM